MGHLAIIFGTTLQTLLTQTTGRKQAIPTAAKRIRFLARFTGFIKAHAVVFKYSVSSSKALDFAGTFQKMIDIS